MPVVRCSVPNTGSSKIIDEECLPTVSICITDFYIDVSALITSTHTEKIKIVLIDMDSSGIKMTGIFQIIPPFTYKSVNCKKQIADV